MIILILALSIVSAILYRAGGLSKEKEHWIPTWMRHSWVRDWLCPTCCLLPIALSWEWSWWLVLAYGAMGGMLTTYWDRLFKFANFWFSGFAIGIAGFFLVGCGVVWWLILARAIVLALVWGTICAIAENDFVEEYGRGSTLSLSSLILIV